MNSPLETGRVALVTGGGRGIGRAIALELGRAGVRVVLTGRTASEVDSVVKELRGAGAEATGHVGDLTSPGEPEAAVQTAIDLYGALDILVNNAGIAPSAKLADTTREDWNRTIGLNLTAPFLACRAALPGMLEKGWGRIVNIASTAGKTGYAYTSAYTASKHGLVGLTRAIAAEVKGAGVTVNALCPGFTDTRLTEESVARLVEKTGRSPEEARAALERQNPAGRFITPGEIASAVIKLVQDDSGTINGEAIDIEGDGSQS